MGYAIDYLYDAPEWGQSISIGLCFECGQAAYHLHHVVPRSLGGTQTVPMCTKCHGIAHGLERMSHPRLTRLGIERAKQRGVRIGRPALPPDVTQDLIRLWQEGRPYKQIAKDLGLSEASVTRTIRAAKKNGMSSPVKPVKPPPPPPPPHPQTPEIIQLWQEWVPYTHIASKLGVTLYIIERVIAGAKKDGVQRLDKPKPLPAPAKEKSEPIYGARIGRPPQTEKHQLIIQLWQEGKTYRQMVRASGMTEATVTRVIREAKKNGMSNQPQEQKEVIA